LKSYKEGKKSKECGRERRGEIQEGAARPEKNYDTLYP
jgi:hypothetical protein